MSDAPTEFFQYAYSLTVLPPQPLYPNQPVTDNNFEVLGGLSGGSFAIQDFPDSVADNLSVLGDVSKDTFSGGGSVYAFIGQQPDSGGAIDTTGIVGQSGTNFVLFTNLVYRDTDYVFSGNDDNFSFDNYYSSITVVPGTYFSVSDTPYDIPVCFLAGTHILTPTGEVPVEDLTIGNRVVTRFGGIQTINWMGRQSYLKIFLEGGREKVPVCIRAGSLGDYLPARDLYVSPGHSMLIGDSLVLARSLINGLTITQDWCPSEIHYYHIELERHDCVLADGAWSETYADCEGRHEQFHNSAEFKRLFPEHRPPKEEALCAPRPEIGAKLDALLRPIVARAAALPQPGRLHGWIDRVALPWTIEGWAQDESYPELPVLLEVVLEERVIGSVLACDFRDDLRQAGIGQGRCGFSFFSPVRIRPELADTLQVRRAIDGAKVQMVATCKARLAEITSPRDKATLHFVP